MCKVYEARAEVIGPKDSLGKTTKLIGRRHVTFAQAGVQIEVDEEGVASEGF